MAVYSLYLLAVLLHFVYFSNFFLILLCVFVYWKTTHPFLALLLLPLPIILNRIRNELILIHLKLLKLLPRKYLWLWIITILQLWILGYHLLYRIYLIVLLEILLKFDLMGVKFMLFRGVFILFIVNFKLLLAIFLYRLTKHNLLLLLLLDLFAKLLIL